MRRKRKVEALERIGLRDLKRMLDREHARYIVRKYGGRCVTCGKVTQSPQCGHLLSRYSETTRWDTADDGNCHCQCASCNMRHEADPSVYTEWYIRRNGKKAFDALVRRHHQVANWTREDILAMLAHVTGTAATAGRKEGLPEDNLPRHVSDGQMTHAVNNDRAQAMTLLVEHLRNKKVPTHNSQVRQLSPFCYPGGKTLLVPDVLKWLTALKTKPSLFVEPFAGGAIVGLSVAAEGLAQHVFLSELDDDVAAVWQTIFYGKPSDVQWLCKQILSFDVTRENVIAVINGNPRSTPERAFRTIVKNRMHFGGIMSASAGLIKNGTAGRGLKTHWFRETLVQRIEVLHGLRDRISFEQADAFDVVKCFANDPNVVFFVDPPYTIGEKKPGALLYTHNEVDHERLFALMASVHGSVMLTYNDAPEVRSLAERHGFCIESVPMKTNHNKIIRELLILKP